MFPCTQCGCCCRRVGALKKIGVEFPYNVDKNGVCEMLNDNKWQVYENRPTICNIEKYAEQNGIDKELFFQLNIEKCNLMMDEDNIKLKYRIT
jgi:Fe-S-cluster containining protein